MRHCSCSPSEHNTLLAHREPPLLYAPARTWFAAPAPELPRRHWVRTYRLFGLSAENVRTRKILHCDDAETDPRVNQESCRALGIASVVVMPLVRDDEVYGVFELLAGRPAAFEERDFIALQRLSEMIQTAVEHSEAARRAEKLGSQPEAEITLAVEAESGAASEKQALVQGPVENHTEPKESASNLTQSRTVQTKPVEAEIVEAKIAEAKNADDQLTDVTAAESKIAHTNLAEIILDEENTGPIVPLSIRESPQLPGLRVSHIRGPEVVSGLRSRLPERRLGHSGIPTFRANIRIRSQLVAVAFVSGSYDSDRSRNDCISSLALLKILSRQS